MSWSGLEFFWLSYSIKQKVQGSPSIKTVLYSLSISICSINEIAMLIPITDPIIDTFGFLLSTPSLFSYSSRTSDGQVFCWQNDTNSHSLRICKFVKWSFVILFLNVFIQFPYETSIRRYRETLLAPLLVLCASSSSSFCLLSLVIASSDQPFLAFRFSGIWVF